MSIVVSYLIIVFACGTFCYYSEEVNLLFNLLVFTILFTSIYYFIYYLDASLVQILYALLLLFVWVTLHLR